MSGEFDFGEEGLCWVPAAAVRGVCAVSYNSGPHEHFRSFFGAHPPRFLAADALALPNLFLFSRSKCSTDAKMLFPKNKIILGLD